MTDAQPFAIAVVVFLVLMLPILVITGVLPLPYQYRLRWYERRHLYCERCGCYMAIRSTRHKTWDAKSGDGVDVFYDHWECSNPNKTTALGWSDAKLHDDYYLGSRKVRVPRGDVDCGPEASA